MAPDNNDRSTRLPGQDRAQLDREAIALVARLTSGAATTADARAIEAWQGQSAEHRAAFRRVAVLWRETGAVAAQAAVRIGPRPSRRGFLIGSALGGGAAAAAGWATVWLGILPRPGDLLHHDYTRVGEQRTVALADGATVTLDGDSAVERGATPMRLVRGAAFFDTPQRLAVAAGPGLVTAASATFGISLHDGQVAVECLHGSVAIDCRGIAELKAGQRIRYAAAGLGSPAAADPAMMAAWRNGLLVFEEQSLREVVAVLNRHRDGRILIEDDRLAGRLVNGIFHLDRPDEILEHLEASFRIAALDLPGGIVVLR